MKMETPTLQKELTCSLKEVEYKICDLEIYYDDDIEEMPEDRSYMITKSDYFVRIPSLNVDVHEGMYLVYDEEEHTYNVDFSLCLVYESTNDNDAKLDKGSLYWEQGTLHTTLNNYLQGKYSQDEIYEMECELWVYKCE